MKIFFRYFDFVHRDKGGRGGRSTPREIVWKETDKNLTWKGGHGGIHILFGHYFSQLQIYM